VSAIPILSAAALLLLTACGSSRNQREPVDQRGMITADQLGATPYATAYDVVQAMRPQWLRARGRTSINQTEYVKVYLDNSLMGGPDQLRNITTRSISSIRYLDGVEATQRWGLDHGQGAISVSTRGDPKTRG
jgi:hypothetical protein